MQRVDVHYPPHLRCKTPIRTPSRWASPWKLHLKYAISSGMRAEQKNVCSVSMAKTSAIRSERFQYVRRHDGHHLGNFISSTQSLLECALNRRMYAACRCPLPAAPAL